MQAGAGIPRVRDLRVQPAPGGARSFLRHTFVYLLRRRLRLADSLLPWRIHGVFQALRGCLCHSREREQRHQGEGIRSVQFGGRHRIFAASYDGHREFKNRSDLKGSPYRRGDRLTIECVITLDKDSLIQTSFDVPPSDVIEDLRNLLQAKEDNDVIFVVQGEDFPAHKTVLAMRSPVFKKGMSRITIDDMQPAVFEALLQFMYTGSLPVMDDLGHDDYEEIIRHLLVAADRYAVERLKMICESILSNNIDERTVMTTLVLSDQHNSGRLNDACIQFIASLDTTEMLDVMESQGYVELKETCPLAIVELWEKINRLYKSKSSFHIGSSVV
ncbi:unnamed protein product [Alopecurus aequalis]